MIYSEIKFKGRLKIHLERQISIINGYFFNLLLQ